MDDAILGHPDIVALLLEADSAKRILEEIGEDDGGTFASALDQVYADLGRRLHELVPRPDGFAEEETTDVTEKKRKPSSATSRRDLGGATKTPTPVPIEALTKKGLLDRSKAVGDRRQAKAERAAAKRQAKAPTYKPREDSPQPVPRVITPQGFVELRPATPPGMQPAPWIDPLVALLGLLGPPTALEDSASLTAEASLIQWATVDLGERWSPFPPAIQSALLGMVVSRARHLQDTLEVDVGPRIALERLSVYRDHAGLNKVEGLYPERPPQSGGTWATDARSWWNTLIEGLQAQ